jgi:hypothetical protein
MCRFPHKRHSIKPVSGLVSFIGPLCKMGKAQEHCDHQASSESSQEEVAVPGRKRLVVPGHAPGSSCGELQAEKVVLASEATDDGFLAQRRVSLT